MGLIFKPAFKPAFMNNIFNTMTRDIKDFKNLGAIKDMDVVREIKEIKGVKGKKWLKEFREFAVKGNVIDLAVAVIIGGAFGKIVSSLVADIVMPIVGVIIGGVDFTSWRWTLKEAIFGVDGTIIEQAVTMNIGVFIQNVFDFFIIACAVFLMIKIIGRLKKKISRDEKEDKTEAAPAPLSKDQELLTEIRDLLKKGKE